MIGKNWASLIFEEAKREAENIRKESKLEAKEFLYQSRTQFEEETKSERRDLQRLPGARVSDLPNSC